MKAGTPREIARFPAAQVDPFSGPVAFRYQDGLGVERAGVMFHLENDLYAVENRCPHWSTPFFTDEGVRTEIVVEGSLLVCPLHGAHFELASGQCVGGPCVGDKIEVFDVIEDSTCFVIQRRGLSLF